MDDPATAPELPPAIQPLLQWWLPRVKDALGDAYRSALLFGSVALGDFAPRWSDVDVCVVTSEPLTTEQRRTADALERDLDIRFLGTNAHGWASGQTIDPTYASVDELAARAPSRLDAFDRLSLATCAVRIDGEPTRIEPPTPNALRDRMEAFVEEAQEPPNDASPIWFASMIQLLARAIVFSREGTLLPKSQALEQVIADGGPHADDYALALRVRHGGSASAAADAHVLREAYARIAEPAISELRRRVDNR